MKAADPKTTAGRAFVRSLNILLKFARLYGYDHARTIEHLDTAWRELRAAIPAGAEDGLLLGATDSQLLLDGMPLEGSPAERQFAQLLSAAGLASVQFFPSITEAELRRFAHAFPTGKSKPAELAAQLKSALEGANKSSQAPIVRNKKKRHIRTRARGLWMKLQIHNVVR